MLILILVIFITKVAVCSCKLILYSNMHTIKAVIFDLDGTLLDTEDISTRATEMVLSSYTDAKIDWATKQQILGMRGEDWGNVLIRKYKLEDKLSATHLVSEWEKNMGMRVYLF